MINTLLKQTSEVGQWLAPDVSSKNIYGMGSREFSDNQKIVTDRFPWSPGHGTELLFSMGIQGLGFREERPLGIWANCSKRGEKPPAHHIHTPPPPLKEKCVSCQMADNRLNVGWDTAEIIQNK